MSSVAAVPLLTARDLAAPLAWRHGQPISAGQFIAEAQALAESLPARGRPLNLCQDRYHFALGLAAALLRGQMSLLPPNALAETLRQVAGDAGDGTPLYALVDAGVDASEGDPAPGATFNTALNTAPDTGALPVRRVRRPIGVAPATQVPAIASALPAVCLLTSGSTGAPQPHAKCWGTLVTNITSQAHALAQHLGWPSLQGLTLLGTVPPQHSYGLESTVLLAWLGGACFDAGRPFYAADIAHALAALPAPRALVITPFHLKTLLRAGVALPPVALTLCATAPLSPQLAAHAETMLGGPLVEIYGCTEAGQVASRRTTAGDLWTTLGALRIAAAVAADGSEQFSVSGGHVAKPTPLADVLVLHSARHFRLLGRAGDLIHVAGKRSSLAHLNFHLNRIEGVQDGAFWLPDDVAEAVLRPLAFVVAPGLSARAIISALRGHLEAAFVPRRVVHVAALPREATGKLTAAALRRLALGESTAQTTNGEDVAGDITLHIAADHPAFAGHFPGHPVLPGAMLLSLVMQALARRPALASKLGPQPQLDNAKFLAPVGPGATLQLSLREHGQGVAFELRQGTTTVARGQWVASA